MTSVLGDIPGWFDFDDLYLRAIKEAPDKARFLEVGCLLGASTAFMAQAIIDSKKDISFTAIDLWDRQLLDYVNPEWYGDKTPLQAFKDNLTKRGVIDRVNFVQGGSLQLAEMFRNESLDFVFFDSDHSEAHLSKEIVTYLPKMKKGSIMAGHDFNNGQWPGVKIAVERQFGTSYERMRSSWWVHIK